MTKSINHRSDCPLSCALDIFGDKWTLLIIRDIGAKNKNTFKDFHASNEGISTNVLSNRLKRLVEQNIISKRRSNVNKLVFIYELTEKGEELRPILLTIGEWGRKNIPNTKPMW